MKILCGDIGGTNARFALWSDEGDRPGALCHEHVWPSAAFAGVEGPLQQWYDRAGLRPDRVCLAIAGPVFDNRCRTTNLPWRVDGHQLTRSLGVETRLVNDFFAAARGISGLDPSDLVKLTGGEPVAGGAKVVIGAGTGLGEAFVAGDEVLAGEGGHADFAPADAREHRLCAWLQATRGRADWEDVVSGPGLVTLTRFVHQDAGTPPPAWIDDADAPARVAAERPDIVAWFCALLGAEAGNLAMKVLPHGGVYVCGGIAPRVLSELQKSTFVERFLAKGRSSHAIAAVPVWVVTHPALGLLGAAMEARRW